MPPESRACGIELVASRKLAMMIMKYIGYWTTQTGYGSTPGGAGVGVGMLMGLKKTTER